MSKKHLRTALLVLAAFTTFGAAGTAAAEVVGRVRVVPAELTPAERDVQRLAEILNERHPVREGSRLPAVNALMINYTDQAGVYRVLEYDYATDTASEVLYTADGTERSRAPYTGNDLVGRFDMEEFLEAAETVMALPEYREGFASGTLNIFEPMPPNSVDAEGRRMVNVGVMSKDFTNRGVVETHEAISVHIGSGETVRYEAGAPPTMNANRGTCGAINSGGSCNGTATGIQTYDISWPAENPVWTMRVMRPEDSDGQEVGEGTGVRIDNVTYNGQLVLRRADVPLLNVRYQDNGCGPYRDWLYQESCFNVPGATATGVAGFAVTDGTSGPPQSICQSFTDNGNHRGVALHDEGDSLFLLYESAAGWYRYIMGWRFYANGDIEPYFDFGSVQSGCICTVHRHHAFWRFDWAIDGTGDDLGTGLTNVERSIDGGNNWTELTTETMWKRDGTDTRFDYIRLTGQPRPDGSRVSYTVRPSKYDGSSENDPDQWASADVWIYPSKEQAGGTSLEVQDGSCFTCSDNIDQWQNSEPVGPTSGRRTAMWYHAHVYNDYLGSGNQPGTDPETCYPVGPLMRRSVSKVAATEPDAFQVK